MNMQDYWDGMLSALVAELETTPNVDARKLADFKGAVNNWRRMAERTKGENLDVTGAVALFSRGRRLMGSAEPENSAIAAGDATVDTARAVATTTALTVGGVALVLGVIVYAIVK